MTTRRVLVTGSRQWDDRLAVARVLCNQRDMLGDGDTLVVVHGDCPAGPDAMADAWVERHPSHRVIVERERHPAKWQDCAPDCPRGHRRRRGASTYCPTAGFRRNGEMVALGADVVLAFRKGGSSGTTDTIRQAEAAGIPVVLDDRP